MKQLRILQVAPMPFPLAMGSQVYVGRLSQALSRRGHDVTLACYPGVGDPALTGVSVVQPRARVGAMTRSGPHWSRPLQDVSLARLIRRLPRADIVHAHNVEGPMVTALARLKAPVVYGQHTAMAEELPQWFGRPWMRWIGAAVDAVVPRLADASVALSESGVHTLPRGSGVAPPGVDLADLAGADAERARSNWSLGDRTWVAYVGNTDPYQEVPRFIAAMRQVTGASALLVTSSDAGPWQQAMREAGLHDGVVVGRADFAQQRDALAAADMAVCPRRLCRGFPIKLLNQLALGVPTVCAPGSARPIAGVVVPTDDSIGGLASAIQQLVNDRERRVRLSAAAVVDVRSHWTWDARASDMEAVYRRVIASA